jgi:signal transduction histidine kinase
LVPVIALSEPGRSPSASQLVITLAALGLLVWGTASEVRPGLAGRHLAVLVLVVVAVGAWLVWLAIRDRSRGAQAAPLAVMGLAGGALAVFAPLGLTFVGVAALGASLAWPLQHALTVAATGPLAMLVSTSPAGQPYGRVLGAVAAALVGSVLGQSRRQSLERASQAAEVQITQARADAERARAELLAGRNHLARELHDILAHTLSALSLQLQALDAVVGPDPAIRAEVRDQLDQVKRLVREGLDEARGAVQALREDAPPLPDQLARLAGGRGASLSVSGAARPLPPDVSLSLYRVAQEALTNAVKHAPGAEAQVGLDFGAQEVVLSVANDLVVNGSDLSSTGAGYGLQGIRERILLIGGTVEAGPAGSRWLVEARVPG